MIRLNRNGFTLIELLAILALLAIIMGISGFSIVNVLNDSRENNYNLLIENINSAVEQYRIECRYVNDGCDDEITLGYLVTYGYLKGNSSNNDDVNVLVNPKNNEDISNCLITYSYENGKLIITAVNPTGACPTSY